MLPLTLFYFTQKLSVNLNVIGKIKYKLLYLCTFLCLVSCSSPLKRQDEVVRVGVAAIHKSIENNRFDLVKKYSDELSRIIAPPKHSLEIKPFSIGEGVDKKNFTILPETEIKTNVLFENSEDYIKVVAENKQLQALLKLESNNISKFKSEVDSTMRKKEDALYSERKKSWLLTIFGLSSFGGLVGVIALCIFFPPAIPFILGWFKSLLSSIQSIFKK